MTDQQGRAIGYLRLSLTRACQMRCTYCRPDRLTDCAGDGDLSADEIGALVAHLAQNHDLTKVRLTGGDPTARPDLLTIIERIARVDGVADLAMTTNGLTLASRARDYAEAGLTRVNVSLDALDRDKFEQITGVDGLQRVLRGIDAATAAGLAPVRLNTVVMRHHNEDQLPALVEFAATVGAEVRFIEMMPMGPLADRWADHYVPAAEVRHRLGPAVFDWQPLPQRHDSARRYRVRLVSGGTATVGFITPMSCHFCADCNRVRVAADGTIYPCLMDEPAGTLMPALRPVFNPGRLDTMLHDALDHKRPEHPAQGFVTMTHIGG
jgi:cyclic pyranopterin phosphate synthase